MNKHNIKQMLTASLVYNKYYLIFLQIRQAYVDSTSWSWQTQISKL